MHAVFRRIALWFALAGGAAACGLALLTVVSIAMRAALALASGASANAPATIFSRSRRDLPRSDAVALTRSSR